MQELFHLAFGKMVLAEMVLAQLNACPMKYLPYRIWNLFNWGEAQKGQIEVILPDGTRCDCVTDTHAIEFDFGDHWSEAVGQSAYYAIQTGKKAGIVLILETIKDRKYWIRLNTAIEHFNLPIDAWSIENTAY